MPPPVPRIARVAPQGPVTRPADGIPVIARLRWASGQIVDVPATAIGWTREAVEVKWEAPHDLGMRTDWIAAGDVRRTTAEPVEDTAAPSSRGQRPRSRW